jgi:uncharacterized membrane protein YfcA
MMLVSGIGVVAFGAVTGVVSALFGVGGGTVMVPFMTIVLDLSQHTAEGTSLLVIIPTAVAGVAAHRRHQRIGLHNVVLLAAGGVLGSLAGASAALGIEGDVLRQMFGVLLALVGLQIAWTGIAGIRQPKD